MPDIPETAELEALIKALNATDRLRRQLDDVRRNAESAHDQTQNTITEASLSAGSWDADHADRRT